MLIKADREDEEKREYMANVAWMTMRFFAGPDNNFPMYRDVFGDKKTEKGAEETLADIVKKRRQKRKKNAAI